MPIHCQRAAFVIAAGLLLAACDDDPVPGVDAAMVDAAMVDAAMVDAATVDAAMVDAAAPPDAAGAITFTFPLTSAEEVPPCAGAAAGATGSATVTIDAANTSVEVTNLTFTGLSGAATAAHIHSGAVGVAGPIVLDFGTALTSPINRTFTAADYPSTPPTGAPPNFAAFVAAMRSGMSYINVHTAECPAGEVRGQIL